jgi:predicted Rossmann-fold nucleotide-binding protein
MKAPRGLLRLGRRPADPRYVELAREVGDYARRDGGIGVVYGGGRSADGCARGGALAGGAK